ncbi:restriction endonuclease subunit S [Halobacteriovorax sp. DA5]|uniref:restriction endonuclease subunit S n=1 Tax=Halobacteriovorax sp. DA5 TaxID=2067553 RepID=UPI000CD23EF8|nr:restriction endonuclease subunit S [Halobacteriovorax sp. DA5]POB13626.1 hypothetical protein C0Z22_10705 [Halobacteriovorax sp. DA5]
MSDTLKGWERKKLKDVIKTLQSGLSRKLSSQDIGLPLITSGNIIGDKFSCKDLKYWYRDDPQGDDTSRYFLNEGDILLSFINSFAKIGYPAIFNPFGRDTIFSTNLFRIRAKTEYDQKFLFYLLSTNQIRAGIHSITKPAVNQASFTKPDFLSLKCELPSSIDEQRKIAEILTSVDKVIELTEIEIEKLKNLKKGMMQDLLTKGIGHTKFKDGPIGKIPESWEVTTFEDNCKVRQGLQIAISNRHKVDGPNRYKYITVKFIKDYANPEYIDSPPASVVCEKSDILMTRTGNTGQVVTNEHGVFHNNFFLIDFNRKKIDKDYLYYYLNSDFMQLKIEIAAGSTTIPDLNHGDFYRLPLIIPGIEEQTEIAIKFLKFDEVIQAKSKKLKKLKNMKKGLMQDLLTGKVRVKV